MLWPVKGFLSFGVAGYPWADEVTRGKREGVYGDSLGDLSLYGWHAGLYTSLDSQWLRFSAPTELSYWVYSFSAVCY
jgi:hypothetical protein